MYNLPTFALLLSPFSLLAAYGLGGLISQASDTVADPNLGSATSTPTPGDQTSQRASISANDNLVPDPIEFQQQLEFSSPQSPAAQAPRPVSPTGSLPTQTVAEPSMKLPPVRVDQTKLNAVIQRSIQSPSSQNQPRTTARTTPVPAANRAQVVAASMMGRGHATSNRAVPPNLSAQHSPHLTSSPPPSPSQARTAAAPPRPSPAPTSSASAQPIAQPIVQPPIPQTRQSIAPSPTHSPTVIPTPRSIATPEASRPQTSQTQTNQTSTNQTQTSQTQRTPSTRERTPVRNNTIAVSDRPSPGVRTQRSTSQPAIVQTFTGSIAQAVTSSFSPTTPTTTVVATAPGATALLDTYILGPGDVIQVNFFGIPEYSGQQQILADGTISLPRVGNFSIAGKTLKQAGEAIAALYANSLQDAVVSVSPVQLRPLQVAIIGEIAQPGLYTLAASQGSQFPTVIQALQTAGGMAQTANLRQVQVRRQDQAGNTTIIAVDLLALLQQGDLSQNAYLRDGDVIFVPTNTEINIAEANQIAISNLRSTSQQPVDVAIVGEVAQPGPQRLTDAQPTLIQALEQAGGITPAADLRKIEVRRKTRQGTEQVIALNLWDVLQRGDLNQDLLLQQGDTISIPTATEPTTPETAALTGSSLSTDTIQINLIGEVESPGRVELKASTTLNQAILAAGGFNGRARGEVRLVRFNANGSVSQHKIDVDLTHDMDSDANPILYNNDVILVGRSTGAVIRDSLSDALQIFQLISPFRSLF